MGIQIGVVMTSIQEIQLAIDKLDASLASDFMTDSVRQIMVTAVQHLRDAATQLGG